MFCLNEKVVYPGHGVAQVNRIITKTISETEVSFYELSFTEKDITILVPTNNAEAIGIRKVSSNEHIKTAFKILSKIDKKILNFDFTTSNWNKRNKEFQKKLSTGNLEELLEIYRDLKCIELKKNLSFGEKALLQQTECLLVEEISIVKNCSIDSAIENLRTVCSTTINRRARYKENNIEQ